MTELSLNEMQQVDGGVFPVAYAALALGAAAFGFNVGQAIWP